MKKIVFFLSKYMGKPKKNPIFAKGGGARKSHSPSILNSKKITERRLLTLPTMRANSSGFHAFPIYTNPKSIAK